MFHPKELLGAIRVRLNRPSRTLDGRAFWSLFEQRGEPLEAAPRELAREARCALLVVVTTYRRPEACALLLRALREVLRDEPSAHVLIFNDRDEHTSEAYEPCRDAAATLFGPRHSWLDARARLGKPGFWKLYQTAFLAARALDVPHALFLQDDLEFGSALMSDVRRAWARASDPRMRVLYLFSSEDDEAGGRWIRFRRRDRADGLRLTQWFDLQAFFVDRAFFELLGYRMIPVHPNRFRRRPRISSGVGAQLTRRLRRRANVYQAYPPLVFHGAHASEMNPEARAARTLDNRGLKGSRG